MTKKKPPPARGVLERRRQEQAKKRRLTASEAKLAGLSPAARGIYDAREAVKQAAKEKKSEANRRERKAHRDEYARRLDDARRNQETRRAEEREATLRRAANVLAQGHTHHQGGGAATKRPPKRVQFGPLARPLTDAASTQARASVPVGEGCRLAVAPSVQELCSDARSVRSEVHLPTIGGLATMASASVAYADALVGIGSWGEGAGSWARPGRWIPLVEKLNRAYNALPAEGKRRRALGMEVRNGEYNVVFFPGDATDCELALPPFVDGSGRTLRNDEVVIRMTRPDAAVQHNGNPFFRYKKLEALQREFYYTLHGAVHGFAPPCLAAILFPAVSIAAPDGKKHKLYGALYVMRKAEKDLHGILDTQTALVRARHLGRAGTVQQQHTEALRETGRKAALWLLPVLCRQAKLGVLSFDAKPANYVAGADAQPYAIDFDASMYTVTRRSSEEWPAALLLLLALLTAHVRLYSPLALADGWAAALRPLIIELCAPARTASWMFKARLCGRTFREVHGEDDLAAQMRLEMMTHIYFVKALQVTGTVFRPLAGGNAPKLIEQLLRYCLHGSAAAQDDELSSALGCASAHAALAARGGSERRVGQVVNVNNGGQPWG